MLKLLIVDDEANVREALSHIILNFTHGYKLIGACADIAGAVKAINEGHPDIVLLDIEVGELNAFTIFNHFPKPAFKIIFITAYQDYAIQAFRFSAVDYLMKPVDPDLLIEALGRANEMIGQEQLSFKIDCLLYNVSSNSKKSKKVVLKTADKIHVVNLEEVMYCEAQRGYTTFFLSDKTHIVVSSTLGEYEELFYDFDFIRIHQSYLLNINYIKRYEKNDGGIVVLKDGFHLPVATRKKDHLLELLKKM
jgi:two-component system LytT family response regulator